MRTRIAGSKWPVTAGLLIALLAPANARANHSPSLADREWITQAGNGSGSSVPIIEDLNVQAVLFHPQRFPRTDGNPRPFMTRYLAFGTIRVPAPQNIILSQLAVSRSDDGLGWSAPEPATIRDPDGVDVPFLLNEPDGYFDVSYTPDQPGIPGVQNFAQLRIHYRVLNGDPNVVFSMHVAVSEDGRTWLNDRALAQADASPLVTGVPGTFNARTNGPTEVVYQTTGLFDLDCATKDPDGTGPRVPSPWNCRWVLLYNTSDGIRQFIGIAGSADGALFTGLGSPLLSPGPSGAWDDDSAAIAKVRVRPNPANPLLSLYDLYYSGGRSAAPGATCAGAAFPCWSIGSATSSDGLSFTKALANPVTPRALLEAFSPDDPTTLLHPVVVDDTAVSGDTHARIFMTRVTNGDEGSTLPDRDVFLAYTSPAPDQGPQIRFSSPVGPFIASSDTPVEFWLTDTLGSPAVVDLATLVVRLDGNLIPGGWITETPHLVTALKTPAIRLTIPGGFHGLADGAHVFEVSVADMQGNRTTATSEFVVDTTPPNTKVTAPASPALGFPLGGPRFTGETVEVAGSTDVDRVVVVVSDPLGQTKQYEVQDRLIKRVDGRHWTWTWIASSSDPFFLLPGSYTFNFLGSDLAKNAETPDVDNSATLLIV